MSEQFSHLSCIQDKLLFSVFICIDEINIAVKDNQRVNRGTDIPSGILSICDSPNTASTTVPFPVSESIRKLPPVLSAACLKKGTPSPTFLVVRVVKNGSCTCCTCSFVMPQPLSSMITVILSASGCTETVISMREAPPLQNSRQHPEYSERFPAS